MASPLTSQERTAFYSAAVVGLGALDTRERTARRFGADADARWTQFAGALGPLGPADRLDILLRDAARTWGAAFSPSECFDLGRATPYPVPDKYGPKDFLRHCDVALESSA